MVHVQYKELTPDFFKQMRHPITTTKLEQLAQQAEKIPLPETLGKFFSEEHYSQTFDLLFSSTEGPKNISYFFIKNVLPRIPSKETLLDIGVGNGNFLKLYGRHFAKIWAVDSNQFELNNLNITKRILPKKVELKKIVGTVENIDLPNNHFDLCVLSHVLYYVNQQGWMNIVQNYYNSLKKDGVMVIVFGDGREGKAKLLWDLGGKTFNFDDFVNNCKKTYGSQLELFVAPENFYALSPKHMMHIAGFLLADIKATVSKSTLEKYIYQNLYSNNKFILTSQLKILLITKC